MSAEKAHLKAAEPTPPASVMEKGEVTVQNGKASYSSDIGELPGPTFDQARTSRLLRKMDWNIVPFLALLYLCVMFIRAFSIPFMANGDAY